MTRDDLHPAIQTAVIHLANPEMSLADIGKKLGISKQAVHKRLVEAEPHLAAFGARVFDDKALIQAQGEIARLQTLVRTLQQRLVLQATRIFMLMCLKDRIVRFFPRFKLSRLSPFEKKESSTSGQNSSVLVEALKN